MQSAPRSKTRKTKTATTTVADSVLDECQRVRHIALAAYFKAESRGFAPGGELDDWLVAEREFEAAGDLARAAI